MPKEIERKFLLLNDGWKQEQPITTYAIKQGYLAKTPESIVRIRVTDDTAWLTIKSKSTGISRDEFEYEIPLADAEIMLQMCGGQLVEKIRHVVMHDGNTWEVDVFGGANAGLVVVEIELESEDQPFALPSWVGQEVTDDSRYANVNLIQTPFSLWKV